jgi:hypothetical protein
MWVTYLALIAALAAIAMSALALTASVVTYRWPQAVEPVPVPEPDYLEEDPAYRWVAYGTAGAEVHQGCVDVPATACTYCLGVMAEVRAP